MIARIVLYILIGFAVTARVQTAAADAAQRPDGLSLLSLGDATKTLPWSGLPKADVGDSLKPSLRLRDFALERTIRDSLGQLQPPQDRHACRVAALIHFEIQKAPTALKWPASWKPPAEEMEYLREYALSLDGYFESIKEPLHSYVDAEVVYRELRLRREAWLAFSARISELARYPKGVEWPSLPNPLSNSEALPENPFLLLVGGRGFYWKKLWYRSAYPKLPPFPEDDKSWRKNSCVALLSLMGGESCASNDAREFACTHAPREPENDYLSSEKTPPVLFQLRRKGPWTSSTWESLIERYKRVLTKDASGYYAFVFDNSEIAGGHLQSLHAGLAHLQKRIAQANLALFELLSRVMLASRALEKKESETEAARELVMKKEALIAAAARRSADAVQELEGASRTVERLLQAIDQANDEVTQKMACRAKLVTCGVPEDTLDKALFAASGDMFAAFTRLSEAQIRVQTLHSQVAANTSASMQLEKERLSALVALVKLSIEIEGLREQVTELRAIQIHLADSRNRADSVRQEIQESLQFWTKRRSDAH